MNLITKLVFLICCCVTISANAQTGIYTTVDIKVYDHVYNNTRTYSDCIIDNMDENHDSGASWKITADCNVESVTSGTVYYGNPVQIVYQLVNINGYVFPFTVCRKVKDDTTYIPGTGGTTGTRPSSHREMIYRCTAT
jgi:hypothetical protein